ncbi:MAG: photosystem I protein PsaX [Microcoleaceae cyanobacterium]
MATNTQSENTAGGKFPYPYRLFWAVVLLGGNVLIAYIYSRGVL